MGPGWTVPGVVVPGSLRQGLATNGRGAGSGHTWGCRQKPSCSSTGCDFFSAASAPVPIMWFCQL